MSALLKIGEAARVLGIHPRTLRSWSEQGHIPYLQTPGGHRRFRKVDLESFLRTIEHGQQGQDRGLVKAARTAVQRAIQQPVASSTPSLPAAMRLLSESQRLEMRAIGRKLFGLVIRYVGGETDEGILEEAHALGRAYGRLISQANMSVSETVATFHFFRDAIIDVTFESAARDHGIQSSRSQLYRRLNRFFSEVEMAMIVTVESNH